MFRQPRYSERIIFEYNDIKTDHDYWANEEEVKKFLNYYPKKL